MATALSYPTNVDFERNQLIRAALELVTTADATPVVGQIQFTDGASASLPIWSVIVRDGATAPAWRVLGAINKLASVTGFWSFFPSTKADGTTAAGAGDPPFGVDSGRTGVVTNLNSDRVDSFHVHSPTPDGTIAPTAGFLPAYTTNGRLPVGDPSAPYDAVNKKTLEAAQAGIIYTDPVRLCTTTRLNGARATNIITGAGTTVLSVDGVVTVTNDRILVKDQQQSGGTAVDNGIYTVTNPGVAGSASWVLTRASDADTSGELKVNLTVFVTAGDTNANSQFTCSAAGVINTDPNTWTQISKVTGYVGRRGIVITGQSVDFAQNADYAIGQLPYASGAQSIAMLPTPVSKKFLNNQGAAAAPSWADVLWTDVQGRPDPTLGTGDIGRHARWQTTKTLESSRLLDDDAGNAVVGVRVGDQLPNDLTSSTLGLGRTNSPFAWLWTNSARIKPLPATGTNQLKNLIGFNTDVQDSNTSHKEIRYFTNLEVKNWLALTTTDTGGVPATFTLEMIGTVGAVTVSPTGPRAMTGTFLSWTYTLDFATLDTRWVTTSTVQNITELKTWHSGVGDSSKRMVAFKEHAGIVHPQLTFLAGGAINMGDGVTSPAGVIDFNTDRMRFTGKPVWFSTGATFKLDTALASAGAPTILLGLDASNVVRQVNAADFSSFFGQPALAATAVGFGDATGRLTGNASKFTWIDVTGRLGVNKAVPVLTLDVVGSGQIVNTVASGGLVAGNLTLNVDDTSTSSADWTSRTLLSLDVSARKSGSATYVTGAALFSSRHSVYLDDGSASLVLAVLARPAVGGTGGKVPTASLVGSFYSQPTGAAGTGGSIATFQHYTAIDATGVAPISAHVGLSISNLIGLSTVRGIALALVKAGTGVRHAIYSSGDADNYLAGNLGLGLSTPTARLDITPGSTVLAPMRLASAGAVPATDVLLTTPLAGMIESDLTTQNLRSRLYYTDGVPVRHTLAYWADVTFTNDANAQMSGAVKFLGPIAGSMATATMDGQVIGTGDFSGWFRFRVPIASSTAAIGVWNLTSSTSLGTGPYDFGGTFDPGALTLTIVIRDGSGGYGNGSRYWLGLATYAGRVVDIVVTRTAGVILIYLNGVNQTLARVSGSPAIDAGPIANGAANLRFSAGNMSSGHAPLQDRVYRAAIYNRSLSATEVLDLIRCGPNETDKWGSTAELIGDPGMNTPAKWFAAAGSAITAGVGRWTAAVGNTRLSLLPDAASPLTVQGKRYRAAYTVSGWVAGTVALRQNTNVVIPGAVNAGANGTYTVEWVALANAGTTTSMEWRAQTTATMDVDNLTMNQSGCLVDLDFGMVLGAQVLDWSGRYPGALTGTYEVVRPSGSAITTGGGPGVDGGTETVIGLRKHTRRFSIAASGSADIDHNFGTLNVSVELWDDSVSPAQRVESYAQSTTTNRVTVMVGNMRTTPRSLRAVIIG
jgi:hypothetical protein